MKGAKDQDMPRSTDRGGAPLRCAPVPTQTLRFHSRPCSWRDAARALESPERSGKNGMGIYTSAFSKLPVP